MAPRHLAAFLCALLAGPAQAETVYTVGAFIRPLEERRAALERHAHELSDVDSPSYGRYLSQTDLAEAVGVPPNIAKEVGLWLAVALHSEAEPRVLAHRDVVTLSVPNFSATYRLGHIIDGHCPSCTGSQLVQDLLPSSLELLVTPPMPPGWCEDLTSSGRSTCEAHPPCKWKGGKDTKKKETKEAKCKGSFAGWFCWPEATKKGNWTCFEPAELLYGDSPLPRRRRRGRRWSGEHRVKDQHSHSSSSLGFRISPVSEGMTLLYNGSASHGQLPWPAVTFTYRQSGVVHTYKLAPIAFAAHGASGWLAFGVPDLANLRPVDAMAVCLAAAENATTALRPCVCSNGGLDVLGRRCQVLGAESPRGSPMSFILPRAPQTLSTLQRELDIRPGTAVRHAGATQAVAEFSDEAFMQQDLAVSHSAYGLRPPDTVRVEGPDGTPGERDDFATAGEGSLDVQVIAALAPSGHTTWVAVDPYCIDGFMLAYTCHLNHHASPALVHSVSWGDAEALYPPSFVKRLDYELMKLTMRGLSLIISSGDNGISSTTTDCVHSADLVGSSPWVTSVGATVPSLAAAPYCNAPAFASLLGSCEEPGQITCATTVGSVITSSGYWSLYRDRPSFQDDAVKAYMKAAECNPCPTGYKQASEEATVPCQHLNKSGCSLRPLVGEHRGSPDVALPGADYPVIINGSLGLEDGTSASAPAFAAMVSLLNSEQLSRGQPPLGLLNPWLYRTYARHPEAFQDVLVGNVGSTEMNVCPHGWRATPGWDAASGLGVPLFGKLKQHLPKVQASQGELAGQLRPGGQEVTLKALLPRGRMFLLLPCLGLLATSAALAGIWKALRWGAVEPRGSSTLGYVAMSGGSGARRLLSA